MVSLQPQQSQLRDAAGRSQPVFTSRVLLAGCMSNATKASAESPTLSLSLSLSLTLTLGLALALTLTLPSPNPNPNPT